MKQLGSRWLPRVTMGALAGVLGAASPAWAACTDTTAASWAGPGDTCTAPRSAYTNGTSGLLANGAGAVLNVPNDVTVNDAGVGTAGGSGVVSAAGNGGTVNLMGSVTLKQAGSSNSYGIAAGPVNPAGTGTVNVAGAVNVTLAAGGGTRRAVMANGNGSSVKISGNTTILATGGSSQRGVSAEGGTATVTYGNASIDLVAGGPGSWGIRSNNSEASVHGTGNTSIKVAGAASLGVRAVGTVLIDGALAVQSTGATTAVQVLGDGVMKMGPASSLTSDTDAVQLVPFTGTSNTPTFAAGTGLVVNASANAFFYNGVTSTIALDGATVAAPRLWNATNTSTANFTASGGTYTGASTKDTASTLNVSMTQATVWALTSDSTLTQLTLDSGGVLSAPGASRTVTGHVLNTGGVIDLHGSGAGAVSDVLTVAGNYSGGGTLKIDTAVGDSTSPTDKLVVNGDVLTGATTLSITNVGGAGAQTTGNGIEVVTVTGASPAGAFVLSQPLVVGGFTYKLVQVGKNWYLQSTPVPPMSEPAPVPSLSAYALGLLAALLALFGAQRQRRQG